MFLLRWKPREGVGVSMHDDEICLVKLHKRWKEIQLASAVSAPVPSGDIVNGAIKNVDRVSEILAGLVTTVGARHCNAVFVLPQSQVMSKEITLPVYLSNKECMIEVNLHKSEYFPGISEDLRIDCMREKESENVTLIAARAAIVYSYVAAALKARLNIKAVEIDADALLRAATYEKLRLLSFPVAVGAALRGVHEAY